MGKDLPPLPHAFSWRGLPLPLPLPAFLIFVFEEAQGSKYSTSVSRARYAL
jgi:hypothetical protein